MVTERPTEAAPLRCLGGGREIEAYDAGFEDN